MHMVRADSEKWNGKLTKRTHYSYTRRRGRLPTLSRDEIVERDQYFMAKSGARQTTLTEDRRGLSPETRELARVG